MEILNWLDDHSRLLLSCTVHRPVTGRTVVDTFLATADACGPPASTLTDNGRVYTARHGGGRNEFEYVLAALGIRQKNGSPNHPQTVTVVHLPTGEVIATNTIDPDNTYWRNTMRAPGRWPGALKT